MMTLQYFIEKIGYLICIASLFFVMPAICEGTEFAADHDLPINDLVKKAISCLQGGCTRNEKLALVRTLERRKSGIEKGLGVEHLNAAQTEILERVIDRLNPFQRIDKQLAEDLGNNDSECKKLAGDRGNNDSECGKVYRRIECLREKLVKKKGAVKKDEEAVSRNYIWLTGLSSEFNKAQQDYDKNIEGFSHAINIIEDISEPKPLALEDSGKDVISEYVESAMDNSGGDARRPLSRPEIVPVSANDGTAFIRWMEQQLLVWKIVKCKYDAYVKSLPKEKYNIKEILKDIMVNPVSFEGKCRKNGVENALNIINEGKSREQ